MVKSGQSWSGVVVCKDATGALATPSVGPVGALYVNGTANGATVTVTGSNPYKWTVTLPSLTAGDCVSMYVTATIATIATAAVVAEDVSDTSRVSDVATTIGAPVGASISADIATIEAQTDDIGIAGAGLTALGDMRLANLDAAISTRSTYAGGAVASVTGDVAGKVLGGGASTITGTGARVVDASGNDVAPASDVTTLLNRIGAFTGTGLNTVLGFLRALAAKAAALTPSDLSSGTTYDNTTDSTEALRDRGDAAWLTATGFSTHTAADVKTALEADGSKLDHLWEMTEDDGGVRRYTANALEEGATGVALTAQETRDAMKLAPTAGAPAAGSIDDHLDDMPTDVWASASRTLTQTAASVATAVAGSTITLTRGVINTITLTGLTFDAARTKCWFTVKITTDDDDSEAVLQIEETAGLLYLNGATAATAAQGSLTISGTTATIVLKSTAAASLLVRSGMYYDIKQLVAGEGYIVTASTASVTADVTRAVS